MTNLASSTVTGVQAATASAAPVVTRTALVNRIKALGPWHQDIQITEDLRVGDAFGVDEEVTHPGQNEGVSLLKLRQQFVDTLRWIYPKGIDEKRFLDCACNAGGYCFWAREMGAKYSFGFDVRDHWIKQARFVKNRRTVYPTDRIEFKVSDLYGLSEHKLKPFEISNFKGIFYHLPDPIGGLKIVADLTTEVMFFNTQTIWGAKDGDLRSGKECTEHVMSGVHGLKWYPTGPGVCVDMLRWMGFEEFRVLFFDQQQYRPHLGRMGIIASKQKGLLRRVNTGIKL